MVDTLPATSLEKIIVHVVPKSSKREESISGLSQIESVVDDRLKEILLAQIRESFNTNTVLAILDFESESPVPQIVTSCLTSGASDFVNASRDLADYLYKTQDGSNSAGILALLYGQIDRRPALILMKMELDSGVSLEETTNAQGLYTYNIEEVRNLMLTKKTKVLKVASFRLLDETEVDIEVRVSDFQINHRATHVARFFLNNYLGCRYRSDPQKITEDFLSIGQNYVNSSLSDPERQTAITAAMIAKLNNNDQVFSVFEFADENLLGDERSSFLKFYENNGFPTDELFKKDTLRVEPRLKQMSMNFDFGLSIVGPPEGFERVSTHVDDNGDTVTIIKGKVKSVYAGKRTS